MKRHRPAARRPRRAARIACALAGLATSAMAGCRRSAPPPRPPAAVVARDAFGPVSFRRDFEPGPAGIQIGPGWFQPEAVWGSGSEERRGVAWSGRIAEIYFAVPPFRDAELAALALPLIHPGAPPQSVKATLNGRLVGTFPIPPQWTELRIPLPAAALVSPVNTLSLEFAHAEQPSQVGLGGDVRPLSALFDTLAVVPRGAPLDGGPAVVPAALAAPRRPLAGRPDVFVYLIDTLRADSVGANGPPLPTTLRIDAFSRDAVVFERTRTACSWTLPAVFSIFSGRYPFHHAVHLPGDRLPKERSPWLPALLERAGYETLAVSQWLLGGDAFGLERGFGSFFFNIYRNGKMPSGDARWFLAENLRHPRQPERPLFAFIHTADPHALYEPAGADLAFAAARPGKLPSDLYNPQVFLARGLGRDAAEVAHLRALYEGEVHAADREFGAFVDLLKRAGL